MQHNDTDPSSASPIRRRLLWKQDDATVRIFDPVLAAEIGNWEALLLVQINYLLAHSKKIIDGEYWTYQSMDDWREQFPNLSESTIKRTIESLRSSGYIKTRRYAASNWNQVNYYTLDDGIDTIHCRQVSDKIVKNIPPSVIRDDPDNVSKRSDREGQDDPIEKVTFAATFEPSERVKMTRSLTKTPTKTPGSSPGGDDSDAAAQAEKPKKLRAARTDPVGQVLDVVFKEFPPASLPFPNARDQVARDVKVLVTRYSVEEVLRVWRKLVDEADGHWVDIRRVHYAAKGGATRANSSKFADPGANRDRQSDRHLLNQRAERRPAVE